MYEVGISQSINNAIGEVVRQQEQRDIRPITDGEYTRHIFYDGFENVRGFKAVPDLPIPDAFPPIFPPDRWRRGTKTRARSRTKSPHLGEWMTLCSFVPEHQWPECKITIPATEKGSANAPLVDPCVSVLEAPRDFIRHRFTDCSAEYPACTTPLLLRELSSAYTNLSQ